MLKNVTKTISALGLAAVIASQGAFAGEPVMVEKEVVPPVEEESSPVSGSLAFDFNTHFVSYGADVWTAGNNWDTLLFNPSAELVLDLGAGFSAIVGTWWDVNNEADSSIGGNIQEIDWWAGLGYETGIVSLTALLQGWHYGGSMEQIIDFTIALDTVLAPSFTVHGRIDEGASGGDTGAVFVLGADAFAFGDGVALGTS